MRPEISFDSSRQFHTKFSPKRETAPFKLKAQQPSSQKFTLNNDLLFYFLSEYVKTNVTFKVNYIFLPDMQIFDLSGCLCLFTTEFNQQDNQFNEISNVLPDDLFLQGAFGKRLIERHNPVNCKYLKICEQNIDAFSDIVYHGIAIDFVRSILMDGLLMASTVVSNEIRVCSPHHHIPQGQSGYAILDFPNDIFVSQ
ncbi:unnamed protein product, partial [Rotaria sp. Silwood2]